MPRKNKRRKTEYRNWLGFDPRKYVTRHSSVPGTDHSKTRAPQHSRTPRRGDIWFADLGDHIGTGVQGGCRPVLIVSNDIGNTHADTLNVLPMTGHLKKMELPCHLALQPEMVLDAHQTFHMSMILAEQITTISKSQLKNYVGRVEDTALLRQIARIICLQLGLPKNYLSEE